MNDEYREKIQKLESHHSKYAKSSLDSVCRKLPLKDAGNRTEFERDCHRILHSLPFRRLKHKTQVFFSPKDDHICTRLEHSLHVASISRTICQRLDLNATLAEAIALGHDLGHPPFGHLGEQVLDSVLKARGLPGFKHEAQSLRVIDFYKDALHPYTLNLTLEVRDGAVCHCGEVDEQSIIPEEKDLTAVNPDDARKHYPSTLEGCVARIADKISYLGRDYEDAIMAKLIIPEDIPPKVKEGLGSNNSEIIGSLIDDVVEYSQGKNYIGFSPNIFELTTIMKKFNYQSIYLNPQLSGQKERIQLILEQLFGNFLNLLNGKKHILLSGKFADKYPYQIFSEFLRGMDYDDGTDSTIIVSDFIAGMSDSFAMRSFEDLFYLKPII